MDKENIDFGGNVDNKNVTDIDNKNSIDNKDNTIDNIDNNDVVDPKNDITDINNKDTDTKDKESDINPSTGELNTGDTIEVDGIIYTVAENGDIVDEKGNIFKEANDVTDWLKSVEIEENSNDSFTINDIQESLGVTITDENGNPVEFTNDAAGIKSYVNSVISIKSNELQQAAINRLYQDNPLLKQFQDYVQINGTPKGFGEIPDRSNITLDKNNDNQLVAVIKMAANEFGNKSLNDNYIKYLRDSGSLYDEAKIQLQALVDKDKTVREDIEQRARTEREEQAKITRDYWDNVNRIIDSRKIGDYKIPESFTKEVNGKKIVITPKDFFEYVSNPKEIDGKTVTAYQNDLANLSDEEYLNRELVDAWLMFTGGTYKDLIDMAVKEEQVRQLRIKAKNNKTSKAVKIIKNNSKATIDDIIF